jgi:triosephosphate isomerase
MSKTLAEAVAYVDDLLDLDAPTGVQLFLLPPVTALATVRRRIPRASPILLGGQNAHWSCDPEATGEVSMPMLRDAGADLVEIGHSERRQGFGETDDVVAAKVVAALEAGLTPLVCVGEPAEVRLAGAATTFVASQVRAALAKVAADQIGRVLLAYEPVWAIGRRGSPATSEQIAPVLRQIADTVLDWSGGAPARAVLYGGSVHRDNAAHLLAGTAADGLFVGRAAWTVSGLAELLRIAAPFAAGPAPPSSQPHPATSSGPTDQYSPQPPTAQQAYPPTGRRSA